MTNRPSVEVLLGGQAMEKWPAELFVPDYLVAEALAFFLETGRRKLSFITGVSLNVDGGRLKSLW